MKKYVILCWVFFLPLCISAQRSAFSIGLYSDLFSVPLSSQTENFTASSSGVQGIYSLNEKWKINVGLESINLYNSTVRTYQTDENLKVGASYQFWQDPSEKNTLELGLSVSNSLNHFGTMGDLGVDAQVRLNFLKLCYIATGYRYIGVEGRETLLFNRGVPSWYWQVGISYPIGKLIK